MYSGNDLREKFLEFFESKNHKRMPSASLVPDDPSILLTIAGMVPFKPYFLGKSVPPSLRMTTSQKCVRTNDLDNVGRTARHHTFFEMLGNFSVGDYFKKEVIPWSWEFLTKVLEIPEEKLWISVYEEDDDAFNIWHNNVGIPVERIKRMGKEDNFWEMGATGPCGPCSEIYFDFGPERGCDKPDCSVGCDCDRYIEVWNLVFMEFNRDEHGVLTPLPQQNIDTGMGLERIAAVMQNAKTNFDTDLLLPIIKHVETISGRKYNDNKADDMALRVIADHTRAIIFLICDGVLPGNEGRGYILRRVMRRAIRYGKLLSIETSFLRDTAFIAIDLMEKAYPELSERKDFIGKIIETEEIRFFETLEQGICLINEIIENTKNAGKFSIDGNDVFRLYDTYGFPLELTEEIALENGFTIDREAFSNAMELQRERARTARLDGDNKNVRFNLMSLLDKSIPATKFIGRKKLDCEATVLALIKDDISVEEINEGFDGVLLTDYTPFYAESGGQIGDVGIITGYGLNIEVIDTKKLPDERFVHFIHVTNGGIKKGDKIFMAVDIEKRNATAKSHTATHLLHKALQLVLGEHVKQAGSLVERGKLRFDFSHFSPISSEELREIELIVNKKIQENISVSIQEMSVDDAKKTGAMALFGEKYGETVFVVRAGDFSMELCGGTHISSTGEIGVLKILSESSIGAGLRRIEAVVGIEAYNYLVGCCDQLGLIGKKLKARNDEIIDKLDGILTQSKEKDKQLEEILNRVAADEAKDIMSDVVKISDISYIAKIVHAADMDSLRNMSDRIKDKVDVVVLGAVAEEKVNLVVSVQRSGIENGLHAGNIIKEVAKITGGGGGGRPDMAQAGGKEPLKLPDAIKKVPEIISSFLK